MARGFVQTQIVQKMKKYHEMQNHCKMKNRQKMITSIIVLYI